MNHRLTFVRAERGQGPSWDALYEIASAEEGYVTTQQAARAGYSLPLLNKHVKAGRLARVRRGVYRLVHFPAGAHEELYARGHAGWTPPCCRALGCPRPPASRPSDPVGMLVRGRLAVRMRFGGARGAAHRGAGIELRSPRRGVTTVRPSCEEAGSRSAPGT